MEAVQKKTGRDFCTPLGDYQEWTRHAGFDISMKKRELCDLGQSDERATWLRWLVKEKITDMATSYFTTREDHMGFTGRLEKLDFRYIHVEL